MYSGIDSWCRVEVRPDPLGAIHGNGVRTEDIAMQTKKERLDQLREQFDDLTESLERSGKKRNGTTWQQDRLRAREQNRREMEDLESIPPVVTFTSAMEY